MKTTYCSILNSHICPRVRLVFRLWWVPVLAVSLHYFACLDCRFRFRSQRWTYCLSQQFHSFCPLNTYSALVFLPLGKSRDAILIAVESGPDFIGLLPWSLPLVAYYNGGKVVPVHYEWEKLWHSITVGLRMASAFAINNWSDTRHEAPGKVSLPRFA